MERSISTHLYRCQRDEPAQQINLDNIRTTWLTRARRVPVAPRPVLRSPYQSEIMPGSAATQQTTVA